LLSFASGFSPNVYILIVLRLLTGVCLAGVIISTIVVSIELVGAKYRAFAGLIVWNAWTVALCLMSLQSYYLHDWRLLMKVLSLPYIVVNLGVL